MTNLSCIIFSKNRPMQLCALLESIKNYSTLEETKISVLYKYDYEYLLALEGIKNTFKDVNFIPEYDFHSQTVDLVNESLDYVMFLTDDDLFKDHVDFNDVCNFLHNNSHILTFALRLGKHLNWCYPVQQPQTVPDGELIDEKYFVWHYPEKSWDWNYPLSVNGHVFRKHEISLIATSCGQWRAPNSFEGNMQYLLPQIPQKYMASYQTSCVFNIPFNKVQVENNNIFGSISQEKLLQLWNENKKIDVKKYYRINNVSAHQEVELFLTNRNEGFDVD